MASQRPLRLSTIRRNRSLIPTPAQRLEFFVRPTASGISSPSLGLKYDLPIHSDLFPPLGLRFHRGRWRLNRRKTPSNLSTEFSPNVLRPLAQQPSFLPSLGSPLLQWRSSFLRLRRQLLKKILKPDPSFSPSSLLFSLPTLFRRVGKRRGGGYILSTPCLKYFIPSSRTTPLPPAHFNRSAYGRWLSFSRLFSYGAYLLSRGIRVPRRIFSLAVHFRQRLLQRLIPYGKPLPLGPRPLLAKYFNPTRLPGPILFRGPLELPKPLKTLKTRRKRRRAPTR